MNRDDLVEFHFISPIVNISSILEHGILSHNAIMDIDHASVADPEIQARRARCLVPGGRRLHDYANLYFSARNPMLFKLRNFHTEIAVLRISPEILDLPGVVITDRNASSDWVAFMPSPEGLMIVREDYVYAKYWTDPDQIVQFRKKSVKCAEVLVPDRVDQKYISGAYVSCDEALEALNGLGFYQPITINSQLFFI